MDKTKKIHPGDWKPTPLYTKTNDFTAAWDERSRTFNALRDAYLTDEARQDALDDYLAASAQFEKLRAGLKGK